ncbi:MAG: hypothetical protein HZC37_07510 [Burkholderiales bacterium]|nr:hypothetical protein [Burkholderiales bacterium]
MNGFLRELAEQRWDDHRYYHQSRINQCLHLISAFSFLVAYALLFIDPAMAAIVGWCISMVTRQSGHFFFEPRGFDRVNRVSDEYKEEVKVGYNIRRKIVLMAVWAGAPFVLWLQPTLFGLIQPAVGLEGYLHDVGIAWLALGAGGLLFRVLQLVWLKGPLSATTWMIKILTDPFHDIALYWRSPLALMRGERLDPMAHVGHGPAGSGPEAPGLTR